MVTWYKVKWIDPLFARFNELWPGRTRLQDGTIGDLAHQSGTSGHNPDDTAGVSAERQDVDTRPEVRAADVDSRGVPMWEVIAQILSDPEQRKRFIYIIFSGWIWSASSGWSGRHYTGTDQHLTHAHFSGHPDYDEDARPFTFVNAATTGVADVNLTDPLQTGPGAYGLPGGWTVDNALSYGGRAAESAAAAAKQAVVKLDLALSKIDMLATVVQTLADHINSGGGNVDTAAILSGVDERLEALQAEQDAELRDAVADLGEGGAARVRADAE